MTRFGYTLMTEQSPFEVPVAATASLESRCSGTTGQWRVICSARTVVQ